jgi:hypothetical protein
VAASDLSLVLWYPEDAPGCSVQVLRLIWLLLHPALVVL